MDCIKVSHNSNSQNYRETGDIGGEVYDVKRVHGVDVLCDFDSDEKA